MLPRTFSFLEPFVAASRPGRLVLLRRFLLALERALANSTEREGACVVAGTVFGLPAGVLQVASESGVGPFDRFLEQNLMERLSAAPEGLGTQADWLVRWGPLVEALVPEGPHGASPVPNMVTLAPDLAALFARLNELSRSSLPLMIEGQPGTGRESLARAVHATGRGDRPILALDAKGVPATDVARILFGNDLSAGLLHEARDGTLVIRNAEGLPRAVQGRFARMIEANAFVDSSGRPRQPLKCRFIFVVGEAALALSGPGEGTLDPDFAYRAGTLHVSLPPLASRGEDLAALYRNVVRRYVLKRDEPLTADEVAREPRMTLTPRALLALYAHAWPGNVSEFVAVVREARQRASNGPVELTHLPERVVAALGRPGSSPEDKLRALLVEVAPAAVGGPESLAEARHRVREWRDDQLHVIVDSDTEDRLARAIAEFNALREGAYNPMPFESALAQVFAAAAREVLLPTGISVPLFWEERVELVSELEELAARKQLPGAIARRLFDFGRALVLYRTQALAQLVPSMELGVKQPSALTRALLVASEA